MIAETNRLILRRYRESDLQDLYEYLSDPEVVAFEPYKPMTLEELSQVYLYAVVSLLDGKLESIEKTAKTAQSAYTDKADRLNAGTDGLLSALSQLQRALGDMTRSVQAAGDALGEKADKEG